MTTFTRSNEPYEIITSGHWSKSQVQINWIPEKQSCPSPIRRNIETFWHENILSTPKKDYIYNGELCSLGNWRKDNKLILDLRLTNYKELIYSNFVNEKATKNQPAEFTSNALGISVLLITKDKKLLMMQRSLTVGECPDLIDVVGGHIEPDKHAISGIPDPFVAMQAEISEELNYQLSEAEILYCIGIIKTTNTRKPELIFTLRINLTSNEITTVAQKKQSEEISRFITIKNEANAISEFIASNLNRFSPSAIGAVQLYLNTAINYYSD